MKKILVCLFLITSISLVAQDATEIKWEDLVPSGLEFEDPFLELTDDQLYNLKYVYKAKLLMQNRPESISDKTRSKVDSMEQKLLAEGVRVEYLISQKDDIREKRQKMAESVVSELDGKKIRLAGFLLPLEASRRVVNEFLFVPYVGACIHQPTPPKNQIIYFEFPEGYQVSSRYDPAWIEGELLIKDSSSKLQLVDGVGQIESGYYLNVSQIEPYYQN